jgi:hypothetical protein
MTFNELKVMFPEELNDYTSVFDQENNMFVITHNSIIEGDTPVISQAKTVDELKSEICKNISGKKIRYKGSLIQLCRVTNE